MVRAVTIDELFEAALAASREGRLDEAESLYRRVISGQPGNAQAHYNLGNVLRRRGRNEEAVGAFEQALLAQPAYPKAMNNLAQIVLGRGEYERAIGLFGHAISLQPEMASAYHNLSIALMEVWRLDEAIAAARQAVALAPSNADAWASLGTALSWQGQAAECLKCHERAVQLKPDDAGLHSNWLFATLMHEGPNPREVFAEHRRWNDRHAAPLAGSIRPHGNARSADRKLRVGYVSPYLGKTTVGWNLLPLLTNHDHSQIEVFCYSSGKRPDEMTERLAGLTDTWREIARLTDEQAAELIREDRIDILVDLAVHTAGNRLLAFARKPAPVQVTYLGYCGTTGMDAMDYRLSDPWFDPPGADADCYSERTVRLPHSYWCYGASIIEGSGLPALRGGGVTFGCMNEFRKISDSALSLWGGVLARVPMSRLLLYAPAGSGRERVIERLGGAGVERGRIEFVDRQSWPRYMRTYDRIDIGLDTLPYGGGIATCDSMWMGVPVVTLIGEMAVGRGAFSIVNNIGLAGLAARTREEFVRIVVELAEDLPRLSEMRSGLRDRMARSPLRDGKGFARDVEAAYRGMWREWCQG
jgi:protein O-GlcNAc transferase